MTKNVGSLDRGLRIVAGVVLLSLTVIGPKTLLGSRRHRAIADRRDELVPCLHAVRHPDVQDAALSWLPEGPARPTRTHCSVSGSRPLACCRAGVSADDYQVRWIGLDHESTEQVLALIEAGDKTGTFTLPWIVAKTDQPAPRVGDRIILIDYLGRPRLLVRLTAIEEVTFGSLDERHTAVDGTPVRPLTIWKPLHTRYWNAMLGPFGLQVTDEMPVLVERLQLIARANPAPVAI